MPFYSILFKPPLKLDVMNNCFLLCKDQETITFSCRGLKLVLTNRYQLRRPKRINIQVMVVVNENRYKEHVNNTFRFGHMISDKPLLLSLYAQLGSKLFHLSKITCFFPRSTIEFSTMVWRLPRGTQLSPDVMGFDRVAVNQIRLSRTACNLQIENTFENDIRITKGLLQFRN